MTYDKYDNADLIRLWKQNRSNDILLVLINRHKTFIRYLIRKNFPTLQYHMEDLMQDGIVGFLEGIEKYDANKETEIVTYVGWYILKRLSIAARREVNELKLKSLEELDYYEENDRNSEDLEALLNKEDLNYKIRKTLKDILVDYGSDYLQVLEGMLDGKTAQEMSTYLSCPHHRVIKMKYKITELAANNETINNLFQELY